MVDGWKYMKKISIQEIALFGFQHEKSNLWMDQV